MGSCEENQVVMSVVLLECAFGASAKTNYEMSFHPRVHGPYLSSSRASFGTEKHGLSPYVEETAAHIFLHM